MVAAIWGIISAYSLLLGGLISIIPNAYFANKMFREVGARAMERVVKRALVGEVVKIAMIGLGFVLALMLVKPVDVLMLFVGFSLAHIAGIVETARQVKNYSQSAN